MLRRTIVALLLALSAGGADRCDLLVQAAVDSELEPVLAALKYPKPFHIAAWTFWRGAIGRKSVVVSRTEVGPINAVAARCWQSSTSGPPPSSTTARPAPIGRT